MTMRIDPCGQCSINSSASQLDEYLLEDVYRLDPCHQLECSFDRHGLAFGRNYPLVTFVSTMPKLNISKQVQHELAGAFNLDDHLHYQFHGYGRMS